MMLALAVSSVLMWSCHEAEPAYLFAEQAAILTDQEPYKATIEVKANVDWSVSSEDAWCSVYGEKGSYKGSFEVVVDRNTTIEDRTTNIVLKGGGQTFVIPVTQTAASFGFSVPVAEYSVNNQNQTVKIAYVLTRKGATVEAFSSTDWAKVGKVGDNVAEIEIEANKTGKVRDAEISLVASGGTGDPLTVKATVTQSSSEDILEVMVENVALGSEGETRRIPVQSNSEMDVLSSEAWCIAAADGSFIVISAEANTTGQAREAFVSLSLKDANEGTRTKLIKVTQAASDVTLELPITEVTLNRSGDVIKVPFTSDSQITLATGADWSTATVADGFIAISATENNTGDSRTDYVTVKATKNGVEISKLITITQTTEAIALDVAMEELLLNADGATRNIPYSSDCDVTVKSSEPWLKAEVVDGNIAVSADPNTTASVKEGYLTVTAAGKGKKVSKSIRVLQSKSDIALELTAEEVLLTKSGEAQVVPFMSTSEVAIESGAQWCSATVSGQFISISAEENTTGAARSTYIVVKTNSGTDNDIAKSIKVTQASSEVALDIPVTEASLNKYGSEVKLPYTASCEISVESNVDWCFASVKGNYIAIIADENTTTEERQAIITVKTESGTEGDVTMIINVTQGTEGISLELQSDEVKLDKAGDEVKLPFTASGATISIESGAQWCSAAANGQFLCFTAEENKTGEERTAYVNVVAKAADGVTVTKVVRVIQTYLEVTLDLTSEEVILVKSGDSQSVPYTSSASVKATSGASWCTATVSGQFIKISASANKTGSTRTTYVVVKTNSGTEHDVTKSIKVTQTSEDVVLEMPVTSATLDKKGGEIKLPYTASCGVSAKSNSDWCSVSVKSGYVVIAAEENLTGEDRKALVTVTTNSGTGNELTETITVVQTTKAVTLDVHTDAVTLNKAGDEMKVPFTSSCNMVSTAVGASWCSASVSGQFVTISAEENKTAEPRSTYVTVTADAGDGNSATKVIKVTQVIEEIFLEVEVDEVTLDKEGSTVKIPYSSSSDVVAESGASWCSASIIGNFVEITAGENKSGKERSCFVTVTTKSGTGKEVKKTIAVSQTTKAVTLDVHADKVTLGKAGDETKVPFTSSCTTVSAEAGASWCSASVSGKFIAISAEENKTSEPRSTYVTVIADGGDGNTATKVIKVTQVIEEIFLEVEVAEVSLDKDGSTVKIPYSSSSDVVVESGASWCSASISGNFVEISAEQNKSGKERSCFVTVTTKSGTGKEVKKTIAVSQGVVGYVLSVSSDRVLLNSLGDDVKIPFIKSSSATVSITTGAQWLKAVEKDGYVKISAQENKTGDVRKAYVTLQLEGVSDDQNVVCTIEVIQTATEVALYIPENEYAFRASGESRNIPYECEYAVTATSSESWLTVAEPANGLIAVTAAANETGVDRVAYVTVKTNSGTGAESSLIFKAIQYSKALTLEVAASEVELDYEGTAVKIPYSASCKVVATSTEDWCHAKVTDGVIEISADSNENGSERNCYLTVKTDSGRETELVSTIVVKQTVNEVYFELGQTAVEFGHAGGQSAITLSSSGNWAIDDAEVKMADWVSVSPTEGTGDAVLTIAVKANPFARTRNTQIVFRNTDSDLVAILDVSQDENPNGIKDYMYLGKGYDVSGLYAEESGVKASVLDCDALASGLHIADLLNYNMTEEDIVYGKTLSEYEKKYTVNAGVSGEYSGFSASVEANFSETAKGSSEYAYATLRSMTKKLCLKIYENETASDLIDCVTETFLSDVEKLTAEQLVDKYGTHVITGFSLGGVLEYSMAADAVEVSSEVDWGLAVKAGYGEEAVGKAEASASYSQFSSVKNASSSYESRLKCRGGQSQYASMGTIPTDGSPYSSSTYSEWLTSLEDSNHWVLVDYEGSQLIPLWDFIESTGKKAAVKAECESRLTGVKVSQTSNYKTFRLSCLKAGTNMGDSGTDNEFGLTMNLKLDSNPSEEFLKYTNNSNDKLNVPENGTTTIGKDTKEYKVKYTQDHTFKITATNIKEFDNSEKEHDVFDDINFTLTYNNAGGYWTYLSENNDVVRLDDGQMFEVATKYTKDASQHLVFVFKLSWK